MTSTSAEVVVWSLRPLQSVKPISDWFPEVDVDWPFDEFPAVSSTREKLQWFKRGSFAAAVEAKVVARGTPAEVWVKCLDDVQLLLGRPVV